MITTTTPNPTRQIRRRELAQFRQSIESWETHGREAGQDGDVELADLRAILGLIESGELDQAAEAIACLDTPVRDQIPTRL